MAVALRSCAVHMFRTLKLNHGVVFPTLVLTRQQSSRVVAQLPAGGVVSPHTSLSRPPWPQQPVHPEEQRRRHAAVVLEVNGLLSGQRHDRLFAVVQFSGRQWKVTGEDLILVENHLDEEARCGDRIRLEKVLMVGGEDFTLIGRPLLGLDLVRVEATVVEKTESWPKVLQRFRKRKRHERRTWAVQPQTVLRINSVEVSPALV